MNTLDAAVRELGSQGKLAKALGVTAMAVSQWRRRGIPVERCRDIEAATHGAVTVHDLRPDVFGPSPGIRPEMPKLPATEARHAA